MWEISKAENLTITDLSVVNWDITSKEQWESIAQCKKDFILQGKDPRKNNLIRKEIAESWIRSRELGLMPDAFPVIYLEEAEIIQSQKDNELLLEVATPLITNFMELAASSGHALELFSKEGIYLAGSRLNTYCVTRNSRSINHSTTAHKLAIDYKRPFQVVGPEHYYDLLNTTICTSAPILDDTGEVLGALALMQDLGENAWERILDHWQAFSLGWVSSLAILIGSQIGLRKSNNNLKKVNKTLSVTFDLFDEGIVAIEPDGTILRSNKEADKILHLKETSGPSNILDYVTDRSSLVEILNNKENVDYIEKNIHFKNEEKPYLISVRPIVKQESNELEIAVFKFIHPEVINSLVTNRSGARAQYTFDDIIGNSPSIVRVKNMSRRFVRSPENVLLLGESGTGKELFAQAIHNSSRPSSPFIAVNCAAMPRSLIESELFGYESGAFTGAEKNGRPGKIELANGGTLFLDEIGDMPYELQAVLLRVLQDKKVMRIGGKRYHQVNFRLIAATNQNLEKLVAEKVFRGDLYFRLSVLSIEIPPLRERESDIALLAEHFVKNYSRRIGLPKPVISPAALDRLLNYDWPGNVRQLENAMIYAVNMAENRVIDIQHLPKNICRNRVPVKNLELSPPLSPKESMQPGNLRAIDTMEKIIIQNALYQSGHKVAKAAKLLGISKATIYRKAKKYNICLNGEDI